MVDIRFGELRIGRISGAAGVHAGMNELYKRSHSSKRNQAFGTVNGRMNRLADLRAYACDRDEIDMYVGGRREER